MTVLCTGSAGFIGQHLVRALKRAGEMVLMCDPRTVLPDPTYTPATVYQLLRDYSADLTAIFHLGAISDTTCTDAKALEETNVRLTVRLGQFAESRGIPFIYASSASVYGNGHGPLNAYALSKISADEIMEARVGGQWYGLRFFNVYGPGEEHKGEQRSMVSKAITACKSGEPMRFYDLKARRDFIHVDDVVKVMLWMWRQRPRSGLYDVGTSHARSIDRVCDVVQACIGSHSLKIETGVPDELKGKLQMHTKADLSQLIVAGWRDAFMPLEIGVLKMLAV